MEWFVEPHLRHLVAETLGVEFGDLAPEVSLADDLAADSLDLAELAVRLESDLGIPVPDRLFEEIGTYGDLVHAISALLPSALLPSALLPSALLQERPGATLAEPPPAVRARLVTPQGQLLRAGLLTPYLVETMSQDALHAGRGTRLELTLGADADDRELGRVREQFAWLRERGLEVSIARAGGCGTASSAAA